MNATNATNATNAINATNILSYFIKDVENINELNCYRQIINNQYHIIIVYKDIKLLKDTIFKDSYLFNKFYIYYRKKYKILVKLDEKPIGDKWSFDKNNRKKIPKNTKLPILPKIINNKYTEEATNYINKYFNNNYGEINFIYPITHQDSERWFNKFLKYKMDNFGEYEDATIENHPFLFHSVITPMLNIGLLTDKIIIKKVLKHKSNIQNIEGFIRQIFWRNYMMTIYMIENPIIKIKYEISIIYDKLWNYKTNMYPIDSMIKTYILPYAYSHHITRLMYFGNFFKLCLLKNDIIYRWFMEAFIDAYSWVMYGNVYGMILNKIKIMTKNYIASSNYIFKMSNFKNINNWKEIFDALYYNYINENYPELFTIADAKRGDIGNTSSMYAKAFFETLPCDAITVAPYMGADSILPFFSYKNKWVVLLALTSNQGSADFQMLEVKGQKLYAEVIKKAESIMVFFNPIDNGISMLDKNPFTGNFS